MDWWISGLDISQQSVNQQSSIHPFQIPRFARQSSTTPTA
jgi:hypothetical protein